MPQFLSSTSNTANTTVMATSTASKTVINKTGLNNEMREGEGHRSHHLHSRSDQHHVDNSSGDEHGEYSNEDEEHGGSLQKRNGYHLKISSVETVSRTPKDLFTDQVGDILIQTTTDSISYQAQSELC